MPCTTLAIEEFAIVTLDGHDAGHTDVALDVQFDRSGNWHIDTTGFIKGWKRAAGMRFPALPDVAWLPAGPLDTIIRERAVARYRNRIIADVHQAMEDEFGPAPDQNAEHRLTARELV